MYFGCRHSFVYALDAATGTQKWKFSTDGSEVNNSPAVYQGMVYLGTSIPGILHALDAKTGTSIFQLPTGTRVFCSMAVAHGILDCGNFSGKITAIDLKTQKPIWVFESEASKQNALAITDADGSCNFENIFPSPNPYL